MFVKQHGHASLMMRGRAVPSRLERACHAVFDRETVGSVKHIGLPRKIQSNREPWFRSVILLVIAYRKAGR